MEHLGLRGLFEGRIVKLYTPEEGQSRMIFNLVSQTVMGENIFPRVYVPKDFRKDLLIKENICVTVDGQVDYYNDRIMVYADWVTPLECRRALRGFIKPIVYGEGIITDMDWGKPESRTLMKLNVLIESEKNNWFLTLRILRSKHSKNSPEGKVLGSLQSGKCIRFVGALMKGKRNLQVFPWYTEVVGCSKIINWPKYVDINDVLELSERLDEELEEEKVEVERASMESAEAEEIAEAEIVQGIGKSGVKIEEGDEEIIIEIDEEGL